MSDSKKATVAVPEPPVHGQAHGGKPKKARKKRVYTLKPAAERFAAMLDTVITDDPPMATPCKIWKGKGLNFNIGADAKGIKYAPYFMRAAAEVAGGTVGLGYHKWGNLCGTEKCCVADHLTMDGGPVPGIRQAKRLKPEVKPEKKIKGQKTAKTKKENQES